MLVREFATREFIAITPEHTIGHCLEQFLKYRLGIACVTDQAGRLVGIVTKYTLYRLLLSEKSLEAPIGPAIRRDVVCFRLDDSLEHAKNTFLKHNVAHGVVLDHEDRVVGVLGQAGIIRGFLRETELLLNQTQSLVEQLQDAVISVDVHYKIVTYNQAAEALFGHPRDHVLGQPVDAVFPELYEHFLLALETGGRREPCRIRLATATVIGSFVPLYDWGKISGAVAVLKNITSYEQVAKELETTKKLERTLDSALEMSYDGVMITDEHGKITKVNPAFLDICEIDYNDVIGKPAETIVPELPVRDTLIHKRPIEGEIREIRGKKCVVTLHPIIRGGACEGAIAKIIFHQLDQWKDIFRRLEQLESELTYYRGQLQRISRQNAFDRIISNDPAVEKIKNEAFLAAQGVASVLITGESGTGKELFAEAIHEESGRPGNFVKVNCAAIPAELLESEFFGYADGAFTGARKGGKPGKFELADRGTLFLDEIGDMPLALQAKLLRVLQEQKFERVGDTKTRQVDVRIIAATNKDLRQMIREGTFREDLFYRINVIHIHIPPLRHRLRDIPLLTEHLIKKLNQKMNKHVIGVTPETLELLQRHHWPGNVRELENVLERAMHLATGVWIEPQHLPEEMQQTVSTAKTNPSAVENSASATSSEEHNAVHSPSSETVESRTPGRHKAMLDQVEKQVILEALMQCKGNRSEAAQLLGISRATLYQKMKKYNIKAEVHFHS